MHQKHPFLTRKGDDGFNRGSAGTRKGDDVSGNRTPGRQGQAAVPVGDGGDWPGDQWAANVTNVVKPTRFQSPRENPCYKRRQSKPKNHHYQRKSPQIDDVRNNGAEIHTKNTLD